MAGFCAGCLSVNLLPALLPVTMLAVCLLFLPAVLWVWRRYRAAWPLALYCGFLLTHVQLQGLLAQRLPGDFDQELTLRGQVISLPVVDAERVRFLLRSDTAFVDDPGSDQAIASDSAIPAHNTPGCLPHCVVRVDWYRNEQRPRAGERWQLRVRLRPPHGPMNHLGFDAQRQALNQGYAAVAVVRDQQAVRLEHAAASALDRWRQEQSERLQQNFPPDVAAVLRALLLGDRGGLDDARWESLARTGTGHLIAISGLHVGLAGGMGYLLVWLLTRLWPRVLLRYPLPLLGSAGAGLCALAYAVMAGLSLPTQRAVIMLALGLLIIFSRRQTDPWQIYLTALAAVLAAVPQAPLGAGFWLSFAAVAWLIYGFYQRPVKGVLRGFIKAQLLVSVGLLPLSLLFFQNVSLVGIAVNLVAVPWVSVVVLPLGLLLLTMQSLGWDGTALPMLTTGAVRALLWVIDGAAHQPWASWQHGATPVAVVAALVGMVWLLAPRGVPLRALGLLWCLPLLFPARPGPAAGEFWLYHFDVGQGLAVAIRTQNHLMLYDTGPGNGHGRDWVAAGILPWLRQWNAPPLDLLMLSHGDLDHAGGVATARRVLQPRREMAPQARPSVRRCVRGQQWTWDNVTFSVLHPGPYLPYLGNDSSCVLSVRGPGGHVMLPGDLGREGERQVLQSMAQTIGVDAMPITVLALGHHGSRSSSSAPWLAALQPQIALLSRSRYNRFGFPHAAVMERLAAADIPVLDSARCGGLLLQFDALQSAPDISSPRILAAVDRSAWWRSRAADCWTRAATAGP